MDSFNNKFYLITWVTHSSRISERMKKYSADKGLRPLILSIDKEIEITKYIGEIVTKDKIKILSFNICRDHVHLILVCSEEDRDKIVSKLKSVSSRRFNIRRGKTIPQEQGGMPPCSSARGRTQTKLWAEKYNWSYVLDEKSLYNTGEYIKYNRVKHNLVKSKQLQKLTNEMLTPYDKIIE